MWFVFTGNSQTLPISHRSSLLCVGCFGCPTSYKCISYANHIGPQLAQPVPPPPGMGPPIQGGWDMHPQPLGWLVAIHPFCSQPANGLHGWATSFLGDLHMLGWLGPGWGPRPPLVWLAYQKQERVKEESRFVWACSKLGLMVEVSPRETLANPFTNLLLEQKG